MKVHAHDTKIYGYYTYKKMTSKDLEECRKTTPYQL